jgi:predicted aspartyl protease
VAGALAALAGACGDDEGISYEGTPGMPVEAEFPGEVPTVRAVIAGEERVMLVDTGAPLTILNSLTITGHPEGKARDDVDAFGLFFPGLPTATWAVFAPENGIDGIIGGNLLRHFALTLDYRGRRAWLSDPFDPAAQPADLEVGAGVDVAAEVLGGGVFRLPGCGAGCGTMALQASRVIVELRLEENAEPIWALVDSGASAVVLSEQVFFTLGDLEGRPRLDGVTVGTVTGNADGFLSRVWRAELGAGDAVAALDDVPVLVIPGSLLFLGIGEEIGRPLGALVGGSMLRRWATTFDYQAELLRLAPYEDTGHISPDEYVGVGFRIFPWGDEYLVADVYDDTDADDEGLAEGDVVDELGGVEITGLAAGAVGAIMDDYSLGEEVPVGIRTPGGTEVHMVLVEDLLPSYPAP